MKKHRQADEMNTQRRYNFLGLPIAVLAFASCHRKDAVVPPKAHGLLPFYWDEVSIINHGFSIFYRQNNTVLDQQVLDALIQVRNRERCIELKC
ncbi:hypothetical protein [Terrimonas alba]|uniref:hypothetical protein n=1 Tax=Terrimonas alba TaxID=3349636 RepID=UPI0035F4E825